MKHLLTAIACLLAVAGSAHNTYNHDSDGDGCITVIDVLSVLSQFDTCEEVSSDLMYWLHLGETPFPYQKNLINPGGPFYYEATGGETTETDFAPIFEDMVNNPSDWTVSPGSWGSQLTLTSGDTFAFPAGTGSNFYYFLIPDSYGIPDLTLHQHLSSGGGPNDLAAEKKTDMTINGVSYKMFRVNAVDSPNPLNVTYN